MEKKKEEILIELIQHQIPISKELARNFLYQHQYNLTAALYEAREMFKKSDRLIEEVITVKGKQLKRVLKELIRKSNLVHLTITKNEKVLLSIPATFSMLAVYLYPLLTTLTAVYFINKEYTIKILKVS